jgi:hypothetical protein
MLKDALPKPKEYFESHIDPLGISFDTANQSRQVLKLDLDSISFADEIAWMKQHLHTHPLIGSVANGSTATAAPQSSAAGNTRTSTGRRRSSVGGNRASAIVTQFEVADVDDGTGGSPGDQEMGTDESYPESQGEPGYIDDSSGSDNISLDIPPITR